MDGDDGDDDVSSTFRHSNGLDYMLDKYLTGALCNESNFSPHCSGFSMERKLYYVYRSAFFVHCSPVIQTFGKFKNNIYLYANISFHLTTFFIFPHSVCVMCSFFRFLHFIYNSRSYCREK